MKKYLGLFVGLALLLPLAAGAAEFKTGNAVSLNETVRDNMYAVGGTANIAGTVEGDLYVAGGTVNLMGTVTGDVVVVGGTVIITGKVGQDLRMIGGNATVGGPIGGELVMAGGNISVLPGTTIGGGAYVAGGNINFGGSVKGNLVIAGDQIVLAEGLKVAGDFDYYSQKEMAIGAGVSIAGATNFHKQEMKGQAAPVKKSVGAWFAFISFWALVSLAGAVIISCLLFYLWPQDSRDMIKSAFASPGKELVRGFVVLFIVPIAAIICLATLIGLPVGFFMIFFYIALVILSAAATGLLWAAMLAKFIFKRKETELNWWLIILAVVVLAIIKLIPFIGWIIGFLTFLVGVGVLSNKLYSKLAPQK